MTGGGGGGGGVLFFLQLSSDVSPLWMVQVTQRDNRAARVTWAAL